MISRKIFRTLGMVALAVPALAACSGPDNAHVHSYAIEPSWVWTEDHQATADFPCFGCEHVEHIAAEVVGNVVTEAGCENDLVMEYVASASFLGTVYTDTKIETIADTALGHVYEDHICTGCKRFNDAGLIPTVSPINDWIKGDFDFGWYQYGGADGTTTVVNRKVDALKSKEFNGQYREVSIGGTGSTTDRIYSIYFKLGSQKAALGLTAPKAITFWVYNEVKGGGLLFKAGSEITSGIKAYGEDNTLISENNRDLDFVGLRRYVVSLTPEQFNSAELEIGIWGASLNTVVDYSAFAFVDDSLRMLSAGNTSSLTFTEWDQDGSGLAKSVVDTPYTVDANGKALKLTRNSTGGWASANIFLQIGSLLNGLDVTMIRFTVYNAINISDYTNNGLGLHFGNWGAEGTAINCYQSLDFTGFRTYAFLVSPSNLEATEFHLNVWGTAAAELYFSGFEVLTVK